MVGSFRLAERSGNAINLANGYGDTYAKAAGEDGSTREEG